MTASLWFDDLDLLPADTATAIATDGFYFRVVANGTEVSNAEAIVSSVTSQLFDGASHEVTGWESASLTLKVEVLSPTPDGLSLGAARLLATCRRESIRPLSLTPAGATVASVWDVLVATAKHEYDDRAEVFSAAEGYYRRSYSLTLRCKPFARSEVAVSLPGLPVGGAYSETVVATGASTTGWSTTSRYVTRRNLIKTPSFENGTSYSPWALGTAAASATVVTDTAPSGTKALRVTTTAMNSGTNSHMNAAAVSVVPGQVVPILHRMKAGHSSQTLCGTLYRWYDGSGKQIGASVVSPTVALTTSAYATVSLSVTAPAGAVLLGTFPFVQVDSTQAAGRTWYLDANAIIEHETVTTTTYFDGSTPAAGGLTYYWGSSQGTSGISIETAACTVSTDGTKVYPHGSSTTVLPVTIPGIGIGVTYTGSINVASHRYLRIKGDSVNDIELDGIPAEVVASGSGVKWVRVPDSITTAVSTVRVAARYVDWTEGIFRVQEIATVSHPTSGTGRAISRVVPLVGSMPAEATIEVTNNGNPLGDHLVIHTGSVVGGFRTLRALRTAGPTQTAAASSISGFTSTLVEDFDGVGADTFEIPVNQVTEATYLLTAYLTGATLTAGVTYSFEWQASIVEDPAGTPIEHSIVTGAKLITATDTSFPGQPLDLGLVNLPPTHAVVSGTNAAVVRVKIWSATLGSATWTLDEAWLSDVDNGQVSVLNFAAVGLAGKVTSLEVVPASADRPQQQYLAYSGAAPNQTVREVVPVGWAAHRFDPADGDAQVNVINTATTPGLAVAIEFYPRWDVFAAPVITDEA